MSLTHTRGMTHVIIQNEGSPIISIPPTPNLRLKFHLIAQSSIHQRTPTYSCIQLWYCKWGQQQLVIHASKEICPAGWKKTKSTKDVDYIIGRVAKKADKGIPQDFSSPILSVLEKTLPPTKWTHKADCWTARGNNIDISPKYSNSGALKHSQM